METPVMAPNITALRHLPGDAGRDVLAAAKTGRSAADASTAWAAVTWSRARQRRLRWIIRLTIATAVCCLGYAAAEEDRNITRIIHPWLLDAAFVALVASVMVLSSVKKSGRRVEDVNFELACTVTPAMLPSRLAIWSGNRRRSQALTVATLLALPILLCGNAIVGHLGYHDGFLAAVGVASTVGSFFILVSLGHALYKGPPAVLAPPTVMAREGVTVGMWHLTVPWHQIIEVDVDFVARTLRWRTARSVRANGKIGWPLRWKKALAYRIFSDGGIVVRLPPEHETAIWVSRQYLGTASQPT
jgi:hypothetical protein